MDEINNSIHDLMKGSYLRVIYYNEFSENEDTEVIIQVSTISQSVMIKRADSMDHLPISIAEIKCIARKGIMGYRPLPEWISVREAKAMLEYAKAIEDMRSL